MKKTISTRQIVFSSLFVVLVSLVIILSFNFSKSESEISPNGNWSLQTNLQTLLNGRTINDMTFTDSLTGYAVTNNFSSGDSGYIFKTTNGGDNWFVNFMPSKRFKRILFIGDSIGFACGGSGGGTGYFCKTTDKGNNWTGSNYSWSSYFNNMSVLNKDTIYLVDSDGLIGGVFRTTNGGENWTRIYYAAQYNPENIYMCNSRIGFYCKSALYKTTDGGFNWTTITGGPAFSDIHFVDSLTGYISNGYIYKTTNGGYNWVIQVLPVVPGGTIYPNSIAKLHFVNNDTIWAVGSYIQYPPPPYRNRGILNITTNGGLNWGYQIPDTHYVTIPLFRFINFQGRKFGWAYNGLGIGIHTVTGGYDTTLYTDIKKEIEKLKSKDYKLFQNYPNPFNGKTKIVYKIPERSFVEIEIYDIRGRSVNKIMEKFLNKGEYDSICDAGNLSSGVYFYTLKINGINLITKTMILVK